MRHDHEKFLQAGAGRVESFIVRKAWNTPVLTAAKLTDGEMAEARSSQEGLVRITTQLRESGRI